jgi:hypothetical protein
MRDAERRIRARLASRRKPTQRGWLDALCEAAFVCRPDAGVLFFPWGALGPGYRVPDAARAARLRRALRALVGAGLLAVPAAALLAAASGRLMPALWLAGATSAAGCLCLALLPRGLERSAERLRPAEARARIATALGAGRARRLSSGLCLLGIACLALAAATSGGELLSAASGAAFAAAALSWALSRG